MKVTIIALTIFYSRLVCQWYKPHGINELRNLFVRVTGKGYVLYVLISCSDITPVCKYVYYSYMCIQMHLYAYTRDYNSLCV